MTETRLIASLQIACSNPRNKVSNEFINGITFCKTNSFYSVLNKKNRTSAPGGGDVRGCCLM